MQDLHSLLKRQLKRFDVDLKDLSEPLRGFVESVNAAYWQSDDDRGMLERSLEFSSEELMHANSEMRAIIEALPDLFFRLDKEGRILDYKAGSRVNLYKSSESLIGKFIQDIPVKKVRRQFEEAILEVHKTGELVKIEYALRKDGPVETFEARLLPLIESQIFVIVRNITDEKLAEQTLEQSLSQLKATFEASSSGILVVDNDGKMSSFNQRFLDMWRIPEKVISTRDDDKALEFVLEQLKDPKAFLNKVQELYADPEAESFDELEFLDGRIFERVSRPLLVGGRTAGRVWGFTDVSARKRAEEEKRAQSLFLRQVIDHNPNLIFVKDVNGVFTLANKAVADIYGTTVEQLTGKSDADFNDNLEEVEHFIEHDRQVINSGQIKIIPEETVTDATTGKQRWFQTMKVPLENKRNRFDQVLGVASDITDRKNAENAMQAIVKGTSGVTGEQFFRSLVRHLATALRASYSFIAEYTDETKQRASTLAFWSRDQFEQNFDYPIVETPCEIAAQGDVCFEPQGLLKKYPHNEIFSRLGAQSYLGIPLQNQAKQGLGLLVVMHDGPMSDAGYLTSILRIFAARASAELERKRAGQALRDSEEKFRTMVESAPEAIVVFDVEKEKFVDVNDNTSKLFGRSVEELFATNPLELSPARQPDGALSEESFREFQLKALHGETVDTEWAFLNNCQQEIICEVRLVRLPSQTRNLIRGSMIDITQRKRAEQAIREALLEKEVLLKEIHHRVKNNLQIISSLLNLQSSFITDSEMLAMFKESQNRVKSMALIHEKLYQSRDLTQIDFAEYIRNLTQHLFRSYTVSTDKVKLKIDVSDVSLAVDTAIPCGLMINELASNSLKYAFPEHRDGTIEIKLTEESQNQFVLIVRDDGVGLPASFELNESGSLGLRLVKTLARQLGGEIKFEGKNGVEFQMIFSQ